MIRLDADAHKAAREALEQFEAQKRPVQWLENRGLMSRGDIGKLSGLTSTTLKQLADGKKPTKAQLAALKFALLTRFMGL